MSWQAERGTVFAEFLMAFPVVFLLFLGIVQLCLLAGASLVVRHAAYRAARQASLVLDDDPEQFDGAPRMQLRVEPRQRREKQPIVTSSASQGGQGQRDTSGAGPRTDSIVRAAYVPLAALSPPLRVLTGWVRGETPSLAEGALDPGAMRLALALAYTPLATEVELEGKGDGALLRYVPEDLVRVHVEYTYVCSVPIANRLLCQTLWNLDWLQKIPGVPTLPIDAIRYLTLHGRATMPIHHAPYLYRSEHESE